MLKKDIRPQIKTMAPDISRPLALIDINPMKTHAAAAIGYFTSPAVKDAVKAINNAAQAASGQAAQARPELRPFEVLTKTGFISKSPVLVILDHKKKVFYFKKSVNGETRFNLPPGHYFLYCGEMQKTAQPRRYKIPTLPRPYSLTRKPPKKFKIVYKTNPNKCSVDIYADTVYFDHDFKNYPRFIIAYILYHEKGHYFYRGKGHQSEKDCDLYAAASMLEQGFNPSQISAAIKFSLSNHILAIDRKKQNWENIKNVFI